MPGFRHRGLESHGVWHKGERNEVAVTPIIVPGRRRVRSLLNISARSCAGRSALFIHSVRKSAGFVLIEKNTNLLKVSKLGRAAGTQDCLKYKCTTVLLFSHQSLLLPGVCGVK